MTEPREAETEIPEDDFQLSRAGQEAINAAIDASDGPALDRYAREQYERWARFVKDSGIRLDE